MRNLFYLSSVLMIAIVLGLSTIWPGALWGFVLVVPYVLMGIIDMIQKKHALMRNFPVFGRGRYVMEALRPKVLQYFIETDLDGRPFNRVHRSVVYQRAKATRDTAPFGTQLDVYSEGYEWMNHSMCPTHHDELSAHPHVRVGGKKCTQPYDLSVFNVSAMSFGSLSKNAIMALNKGAKLGDFAHNTGEGGVSPYHLAHGGDLIYQIGTGYFGCRAADGSFSKEKFLETVKAPSVKMIELKLSQGAKPGHGGILPAGKNTPEIAAIRGVEPGTAVLSPTYHHAFSTPKGLLSFIDELRELSGGRPVGFKFCVGHKSEFLAICKAMVETGMRPDFITVDGGEGGTGAAPVEFSDHVGMPFRNGLSFVHDALVGFGLKDEIVIMAGGKITNGFDMVRAMALGADACYSARAMMLALGCIQALECNKNNCPAGVTTHKKELVVGLDVDNKGERVCSYHKGTVESFVELMAAAGLKKPEDIERGHICRKETPSVVKTYADLYPPMPKGALLDNKHGDEWDRYLKKASAESF